MDIQEGPGSPGGMWVCVACQWCGRLLGSAAGGSDTTSSGAGAPAGAWGVQPCGPAPGGSSHVGRRLGGAGRAGRTSGSGSDAEGSLGAKGSWGWDARALAGYGLAEHFGRLCKVQLGEGLLKINI